jgi:hypothetical protein
LNFYSIAVWLAEIIIVVIAGPIVFGRVLGIRHGLDDWASLDGMIA